MIELPGQTQSKPRVIIIQTKYIQADGGPCSFLLISNLRSIASRTNMNTVLLRRNDENVPNERDDVTGCHRIVVKVKRKNSPHIDSIKCDEIQRSALSNLNIAAHAQTFVQLSKRGGSTSTNVVIKSVSNRFHHPIESNMQLGTNSAKETTTVENIERRLHKSEATAMTTATQLNDKLCQYSTSMSMLHPQQDQNKDMPLFQNGWQLQTNLATRAMTQAQQHHIHVDRSNWTCQRSVGIPKKSSADENVIRTSGSRLASVCNNLYVKHTILPSIHIAEC